MNVGELKALLEDLPDEAEVRIASQPSYPMQHYVSTIVVVGCDDARIKELEEHLENSSPADEDYAAAKQELHQLQTDGNQTSVVYIAEGSQPHDDPYLPGHVSRELGWR